MKMTIFLAIVFVASTLQVIHCYRDEERSIVGKEIKLDEPLQVDTSQTVLILRNVTGSIGIKTLSQIPHLYVLTIEDSSIDQVEDGALCSLPNLQDLNLIKNKKFPVLTLSLLNNCDKIKTFSPRGVEMKPDALKNMASLENLQISDQNIPHLTKEYLEPLKNLKLLHLFRCQIEKIDPGSFCLSPNLKFLDLSNLRIPVPLNKGIFENCNTVTSFTYIYSDQATIDKEVFSGLINSKLAHLNTLNIESLTKEYLAGLSAVENLRIEASNITKITADAFTGFGHLKTLTIVGNHLSDIEDGAFSPLTSLEYLYLSGNKLTSIDNISNPNLKSLFVTRNLISKIDTTAVKANLPNLDGLMIFENPISSEDQARYKEELVGIYALFVDNSSPY